jgi:hypothetical protein
MLKSFVHILIILSCAGVCSGSGNGPEPQKKPKPDFGGTWKLDRSKGNYAKTTGLKPGAELVLVISQVDPEIRVTRKLTWKGDERVQQLTYYSDGRGETNPSLVTMDEAKSKTRWSGNKLVLSYSFSAGSAGRRAIILDVTEEWKLSADGKTLTQTQRTSQDLSNLPGVGATGIPRSIFIQAIPTEIKKVFTRIS